MFLLKHLLIPVALAAATPAPVPVLPVASEPVAVIELFTSQGCSSCPPADRLLSRTIAEASKNGKKVFALSFHVDYWNRLGWKDPFSQATFSKRQEQYAAKWQTGRIYTPQMVVNGRREFVGSDEDALQRALREALSTTPAATFTSLSASAGAGSRIRVQYALAGNLDGCSVRLALVSKQEGNYVPRGENGGKTLRHDNVVLQLLTAPARATGTAEFDPLPARAGGSWSVVAFVQRESDWHITGAAAVPVTP